MDLRGLTDLKSAGRRILATSCIVLVGGLCVFAASPTLHGRLHDGTHDTSADTCAVAMLATGVTVSGPVMAQPPMATEGDDLRAAASWEIDLEPPRYLLRPERGPPVA